MSILILFFLNFFPPRYNSVYVLSFKIIPFLYRSPLFLILSLPHSFADFDDAFPWLVSRQEELAYTDSHPDDYEMEYDLTENDLGFELTTESFNYL